jgi:hypothetical protein
VATQNRSRVVRTPKLADLGITKQQSSNRQKLKVSEGQRERHGGDRKSKSCHTILIDKAVALDALGIVRDQVSKWQPFVAPRAGKQPVSGSML